MKVLMLSHHQRDPNAGAAAADLHLAEALRRRGNTVDIAFYDDILPAYIRGTWKQVFFPIFAGIWGAFAHLKTKYDVLDTTAGDGYWLRLLTCLPPSKRPIFSVRTHGLEHLRVDLEKERLLHEDELPGWLTRLYHFKYRLWEVALDLKTANIVFLLNEKDKAYAVDRLQIDPARIHVFPNAIPTFYFGSPHRFGF